MITHKIEKKDEDFLFETEVLDLKKENALIEKYTS